MVNESEVVSACRTLFGTDLSIGRDFLTYVQPSGVKSAYRKKAKETHPDLFPALPHHLRIQQTERFREILRAYEVLNHFFLHREKGLWRSAFPRQGQHRTQDRYPPGRASSHRTGAGPFEQCAVPPRVLQLGQFLYYRRLIPFAELINALMWQRKHRPSFGELALRWGWLDSRGASVVASSRIRQRLFGEKAVALGLLTRFQVNTILAYQRSLQKRLGAYFVMNGVLTAQQLDRLAQELRDHNAFITAGGTAAGRPS